MATSPVRGGFSITGSRGQLIPFAAFLAAGLLVILLNRPGPAQLSFPGEEREMLPSGFVTFHSQCANETVEDPRKLYRMPRLMARAHSRASRTTISSTYSEDEVQGSRLGIQILVSSERLMTEVRPRVVIEIGTFLGASAIHMASLAKEMGLPGTHHLRGRASEAGRTFRQKFSYVRQLNGDAMLMQTFMYNVKKKGFGGRHHPFPISPRTQPRTTFASTGIQADLIEVDAGHELPFSMARHQQGLQGPSSRRCHVRP